MSARAFLNSIKEGVTGIIRHPLVTIASITTILLMLVLMSAFFVFSANARSIMKKLGQQPPIEVYMRLQCTQEELDIMSQALTNDARVIGFTLLSPEQNYENFKANLGSSSSILDGFDYNMYLPYTFTVQLSDPSYANDVANYLRSGSGVNKVALESNVMSFLVRARQIVNVVTGVSFVVLLLIALFIISNMVRISVYARANEIEIMKFVGATNAYIRMPYIIEGALVGLVSAICAWGASCLIYRSVYASMMGKVSTSSFYAILPLQNTMWWVLILVVLMGVIIGAVGSGISVRNYIKV